MISFSRPWASRICSIFPLWMESKALVKSTNNIVACRLFARTRSRIRRIVKICDVVNVFLRKPFWFFLSMLSILGSMRLRSRSLYILAAIDVSVIPRKGRMHPFIHQSIGFWLYTALLCPSSKSLNFLVFHTSGSISSNPAAVIYIYIEREREREKEIIFNSPIFKLFRILFVPECTIIMRNLKCLTIFPYFYLLICFVWKILFWVYGEVCTP